MIKICEENLRSRNRINSLKRATVEIMVSPTNEELHCKIGFNKIKGLLIVSEERDLGNT